MWLQPLHFILINLIFFLSLHYDDLFKVRMNDHSMASTHARHRINLWNSSDHTMNITMVNNWSFFMLYHNLLRHTWIRHLVACSKTWSTIAHTRVHLDHDLELYCEFFSCNHLIKILLLHNLIYKLEHASFEFHTRTLSSSLSSSFNLEKYKVFKCFLFKIFSNITQWKHWYKVCH